METAKRTVGKRDVQRWADKNGCELIVNSARPIDANLDAPYGYHFSEDPHSLVGSQWPGETAGETWEDLFDRASAGLEKCEPGCDCRWDKTNEVVAND
jgi:broad specificity phosphatase PhoE